MSADILQYILLAALSVSYCVASWLLLGMVTRIVTIFATVPKDDERDSAASSLGRIVPEFELKTVDQTSLVRTVALDGYESALLFVRPTDVMTWPADRLALICQYLIGQVGTRVHIVCDGSRDQCHMMGVHSGLQYAPQQSVIALCDERGTLGRALSISRYPAGVILDANRRVVKLGTTSAPKGPYRAVPV